MLKNIYAKSIISERATVAVNSLPVPFFKSLHNKSAKIWIIVFLLITIISNCFSNIVKMC